MTRRRRLRIWFVGACALIACDQYSCEYEEPNPDPNEAHERDTVYLSDSGLFEVTLRADDRWPPTHEAASLIVEVQEVDDGGPHAYVLRPDGLPRDEAGEETGEMVPQLTALDGGDWLLEAALPEPGVWAMPLEIGVGDGAAFEPYDAITLRIATQ